MKGKVDQWSDEKGFGFIKPDNSSGKIFFQLSSVETKERRPCVGDRVLFDTYFDSEQRLKAKCIVIDGVTTEGAFPSSELDYIPIEKRKRDMFDYAVIVIGCCFLVASVVSYFWFTKTGTALACAAAAVTVLLLLRRQKRPERKSFSCSGCMRIVDYDSRTIKAWNKGDTRLYCEECFVEWSQLKPLSDID